MLEKHSKSKKSAREISESITTRPAKRRNLDNDNYRERNDYSQRQPFCSGPSRRGRGADHPTEVTDREGITTKGMQNMCVTLKSEENPQNLHLDIVNLGLKDIQQKLKHLPVGGRLPHFVTNSEMITQDTVILDAVRGVQDRICSGTDAHAKSKQTLFYEKRKCVNDRNRNRGVTTQKCDNIGRISICKQSNFEQYFYSTKKGRRSEAIFSLKGLNKYILYRHFRAGGGGGGQRRIQQ